MSGAVANSSGSGATNLQSITIAIEYRYLKKYAPSGVYVVPDPVDFRVWHGAIFVHQGLLSGS
jgi:hypothetical protein